MLATIRTRVQKTKEFVKKHQTAVACGVTAAVTYKFTHDATLRKTIENAGDLAYEWGRENGVLAIQNAVMLDFINVRGLGGDMQEYILGLKNLPDFQA